MKKKNLDVDVLGHFLTPKMEILDEKEKKKVMEQYKVNEDQFPGILLSDPAIKALGANVGDLIKIEREDETGKYTYYRIVVSHE